MLFFNRVECVMTVFTGKFSHLKMIMLCLVTCFFVFSFEARADISFVVNPSVPYQGITPHMIKEIFLGKKFTWDDHREIQFVLLKNAEFHLEFTVKYLNKTPRQFENYWRTLLFSGKGLYPENAGSVEAMISFVEKNKGAISYISSEIKIKNRHVVVIDVTDEENVE